ncbi:DNA polymerase Y family protein [Streptomyces sp. TLI_171]|uniref:DNA polymerase Y family protein n=1 Tax=Streptomyces sp. TLI_171 TaxID=1938859 RepID=UPI000C17B4A8|nr:DNA polymerase Y family protein [Streptomyces sp. TLI_171]RKE02900.1 protein ImuB [Streptomyces sp. TLI_171]
MTATLEESGGAAPRAVVVWCPDWPVTAVLGGAEAGERLLAVVEGGRVVAASAAARAAGVRRGMKVRSAKGLIDALEVVERDEDAEARLFDQVAEAVSALAARLEVLRPGVCAIPARGAARFHGGEDVLVERLYDAVEAAGFACSIGVADGVAAALLAAREHRVVAPGGSPAFLAPHPVAEVAPPKLADLLVRLGIGTVGALAAMPPGPVADRFGAAGTAAHRLARGLQARPVVPRPPGADLDAETRFEQPHTLAEPMVFAALGLAEQLHANLAAAGLGCGTFTVEVVCADGTEAHRTWRHEGLLSAPAVAERIRWQLQAWQQQARFTAASGGVAVLRLVPDGLYADAGRQLSLLDGDSEARERMERAAARVQALLGHTGVVTAQLAGGRGPGEQVVRTPVGDAHQERRADGPWPGRLPAPSPVRVPPVPEEVRLLDQAGEPVQVTARAELVQPPARLMVRGRSMAVAAWAGPWPATERWWDPDDARRAARLQVTADDGAALLLTVTGGRWHLEGAYDT